MKPTRIAIALMLSAALATLSIGAVFGQDGEAVVVESFDAAQEELPEGLSIDHEGNIYVTMGYPFWFAPGDGWVKKITPDGIKTTLAFLDEGQAPAGIVAAADGSVYFARPAPEDPATRGVYRLQDDGTSERLSGSEAILLANGLAFDGQGGLLVGDSALGTIWRIPLKGSEPAQPWFSDPSLLGGCAPGDVGVNGVAMWGDVVYAANTFRGLLVRIPVLDDGSAGVATVVAGDDTNECDPDALWGMDGIALDVDGNVYALLVLQNQLVRIDPNDGSFDVLLSEEDGLYNPASIAFGTGDEDRESVYMVNYALLPPAPEMSLGPAVLRLDVGVAGQPLP